MAKRRAASKSKTDEERKAALRIQAIARGKKGRKLSEQKRVQKAAEMEDMKRNLQALGVKEVAQEKKRNSQELDANKEAQEKAMNEAATKLQKVLRGNQGRQKARRKTEELQSAEAMNEAATKVQKLLRGNLGRKAARKKTEEVAELKRAAEIAAAKTLAAEEPELLKGNSLPDEQRLAESAKERQAMKRRNLFLRNYTKQQDLADSPAGRGASAATFINERSRGS